MLRWWNLYKHPLTVAGNSDLELKNIEESQQDRYSLGRTSQVSKDQFRMSQSHPNISLIDKPHSLSEGKSSRSG